LEESDLLVSRFLRLLDLQHHLRELFQFLLFLLEQGARFVQAALIEISTFGEHLYLFEGFDELEEIHEVVICELALHHDFVPQGVVPGYFLEAFKADHEALIGVLDCEFGVFFIVRFEVGFDVLHEFG
jgi:hypothetical protein